MYVYSFVSRTAPRRTGTTRPSIASPIASIIRRNSSAIWPAARNAPTRMIASGRRGARSLARLPRTRHSMRGSRCGEPSPGRDKDTIEGGLFEYEKRMKRRSPYSHLEDTIALADAGLLGSSARQDGADVLQRRIQLPVDAPQLSTLADLAAYVEPEARLRLVDGDAPRPLADRVPLLTGGRRMLRYSRVVVHYCHGRRVSRTTVLVHGWQALHLRLAVRHFALWPPIHDYAAAITTVRLSPGTARDSTGSRYPIEVSSIDTPSVLEYRYVQSYSNVKEPAPAISRSLQRYLY